MKFRIGLDLHNLSTRTDLSLRTGIQQVIFALLDSQYRLRDDLALDSVELRPLPMLPSFFGKSRFSNLSPSHINNSKIVLEEVSRELSLSPSDLWLNAVDDSCENWTDSKFYEACDDLDWLIITGLSDFRNLAEKLKFRNPKLKIAVLVYDLGPIQRPELAAEGMSKWFKDCYLESIRIYADLVFTISRHTAIECVRHFSTWPKFVAHILSTPLPPEPTALKQANSSNTANFLERYGLSQHKYFVAIGTIEPRKNLAIAILGFNRFCQLDPDATSEFRFVIIGKQGWRNEDSRILDMIGDKADRFIFPGYLPREEVELAMLLSSGLIMPSRLEGFGLPIALASVYGVPTVTCNNTSLPEAASVTSSYVTTDSPDRMALSMWNLGFSEPRHKIPDQEQLKTIRKQVQDNWDEYLTNWLRSIRSFDSDFTKKEDTVG